MKTVYYRVLIPKKWPLKEYVSRKSAIFRVYLRVLCAASI